MSKKGRINQLLKKLERRVVRKSLITVLFLVKEGDNKMYNYWDWKEKGEYNQIDTVKYADMEGVTVIYLNTGFIDVNNKNSIGFVPPGLKRENFG